MKIKAVITAVVGVIGSAVLLGSFAGCSMFKEKELVTNYIEGNNHTTSVQLDVSDGWSCQKSNGMVLIYDHDCNTNNTITATTKTIDKATYERAKSASKRDLFSQEYNGGVIYKVQATGDMIFICQTGDSYVGVTAKHSSPEMMKKIVSHLTITEVR